MNVLVACIGNIFQGDDAFGCEVAKVLATRSLPPDVRVIDFGIRSLDLTYALLDAPDLTILVDTVSRGGQPGTLYTIEPNLDFSRLATAPSNPHSIDPVAALRSAQAMGGCKGKIVLVACEPADTGGDAGCMGLTPEVAASLNPAADIVERLATPVTICQL